MSDGLKVLLATIGSRGDVQPMLALAQALRARGHYPTVAAPADFEAWISSFGVPFAPLGVDMQAYLNQNKNALTGNAMAMMRETTRFLQSQMAPQARQLQAACAGADVLVFAGIAAVVAPSVAEAQGLPALRVNYTTAMIASRDYPPPLATWRTAPGWLNAWMWKIERAIGGWIVKKPFNAMRAGLGLPAQDNIVPGLSDFSPAVNAVDEGVFPPSTSWPKPYPYANFLFFDDPMPLDPELAAWLDAGPPPVYVGFGSMSGRGTDRVGSLVLDAVQSTGLRCVVGAGWAGLGAGALPAGWRVVREAPHALLFPRMAAVVHHGGSGTTGQALRAGVPQVVLPLILDQFHHAHLLYVAGLAPRPIRMEKITAPQLTAAIQAALALPAGPRQAVASRLRASDGCGDLVRHIEALATTQPAA
jgi:UDP:flavonoid glycosyltransferase YjiC (YdhE family)